VSGVSVSVRVTNVLADRRFAICVDRSSDVSDFSNGPWVIEVDAARQLFNDLGQALDAIEHLEPELR
jgi:hypothetical protein